MIERQANGATPELVLSHSPNAVARGNVAATRLKPSFELSGADYEIVGTGDVRIRRDRLAWIDRKGKSILLFDTSGTFLRRFGRVGRGPGELSDPWAAVWVGDHLVVHQSFRESTFIVFDTLGNHVRTAARPVRGDWRNLLFRRPTLFTHDMQSSLEDVTRRTRADGDSAFYQLLQPNEHERTTGEDFDLGDPPAYLLRMGLDLGVRDTVATLAAPPLVFEDTRIAGALPDYRQFMFISRPVFATGDGWVALGHGDSASVALLRSGSRTPFARVVWPDDRPPIMEADQWTAVNWTLETALRSDPPFAEDWHSSSRTRRQQGMEMQRDWLAPFAEYGPNVTQLFGSGACLFLAGFNPADFVDGSATTILVVNIATVHTSVISVPSGEYIHDVDGHTLATTRRDHDGEWYVRLYRHGVECGA